MNTGLLFQSGNTWDSWLEIQVPDCALENYIFDLDGTIIDSERLHYKSYKTWTTDLTYESYQKKFHNNVMKQEILAKYDINNIEKDKIFLELLNVAILSSLQM